MTIERLVHEMRLALLLLSALWFSTVRAQEAEQPPDEPVEEIVVVGEKSLKTLRQAVYRAEENFFELFSQLNEDEEFDVRCFYEAPTGTRIRKHVCRANFLIAATSSEAEVWRSDGPRAVAAASSQARIDRKKKELEQKMQLLIATNPQLMEAFQNYDSAKQRYESERNPKE